jgi:hypothetical protein
MPWIWLTDTSAKRIFDTLTWMPTQVCMPTVSTNELLIAAADEILAALQTPSGLPTLLSSEATARRETLQRLSTMIADYEHSPTPNTTDPERDTTTTTVVPPNVASPPTHPLQPPRVQLPPESVPPLILTTNIYSAHART